MHANWKFKMLCLYFVEKELGYFAQNKYLNTTFQKCSFILRVTIPNSITPNRSKNNNQIGRDRLYLIKC